MDRKNPVEKELDAGTYYWCTCGRSGSGPCCDGAHKGTGKAPVQFVVTEKKKAWLCACGLTKTPPYCDGTHGKN